MSDKSGKQPGKPDPSDDTVDLDPQTVQSKYTDEKTMELRQKHKYYSQVFMEYQGRIPIDVREQFTSTAKQVMDKPVKTEAQKLWLEDYLTTLDKLSHRMPEPSAAQKASFAQVAGPSQPSSSFVPTFTSSSATRSQPTSSRRSLTDQEVGKTTIKLNELVIKPTEFNGEKPRPRRWIQEYQEAIIANGWTDYLAVKYFPTFLDRNAKDWYYTAVQPYLGNNYDFKLVLEKFFMNYIGKSDQDQLSDAINRASQRHNESASNFIPRVRRLMLMLNPDMPESEQLRQLKTKLRPEYKQLVAYGQPNTVNEFRDLCLNIEAGLNVSKEKSESTPTQKKKSSSKGERKSSPPKSRENNKEMI